jgi:hypothetical protein
MRQFDTEQRRGPTVADAAAWGELFQLWGDAGHREALSTYQLGYLQPRRTLWRRPRPPLPLLELLVQPGGSIDFADDRTGFLGLGATPPAERVLTLWADHLVSVHHGTDWIYVIDADRPFPRTWLDLVSPHDGASVRPRYAVVTAAFDGPTPPGMFRLADVDARTHITLAHIHDRRVASRVRLPARSRVG